MENNNLVLASSSPRRIEMLKEYGINPRIIPANIKENTPVYGGKTETCMFLALKKALSVESDLISDEEEIKKAPIIIAADTIVYYNNIIGKPKDKNDARYILMSLSGHSHEVVTGVAIIKAGTAKRLVFPCTTKVFFKKYTYDDIAKYLDTDEPYDKAGAYAIQGYFSKFIESFDGSLNNVIGFPIEIILNKLEEF